MARSSPLSSSLLPRMYTSHTRGLAIAHAYGTGSRSCPHTRILCALSPSTLTGRRCNTMSTALLMRQTRPSTRRTSSLSKSRRRTSSFAYVPSRLSHAQLTHHGSSQTNAQKNMEAGVYTTGPLHTVRLRHTQPTRYRCSFAYIAARTWRHLLPEARARRAHGAPSP